MPSPADIYNAIGNAVKYNTFTGCYIFSTNGNVYAIAVNDRQTTIAFLASYPASANVTANGQDFTRASEVGQKYNDIKNYFTTGKCPTYSSTSQNDGMESATAFILDKYNSGMSLAKLDANGVFKTLNPKSFDYVIPASGGQHTTAYKTENCP
ncbi:hypothetical protein [Epilithonimonas tenax]|uniref:hypothetical protein n=1 Tax=Epilithonimonas tenax TaxID=191577 RepID=UPI00041F3CE0|nr:hypothetical protein [Epilithonimonas tenax]